MHAQQELQHALIISKQIDYLGGDADGHAQAGANLGEGGGHAPLRPGQRERDDPQLSRSGCASARRWASTPWPNRSAQILVQEQDHQIDLATALGVDVPDVTTPDERA